jgi:hypothetical protein
MITQSKIYKGIEYIQVGELPEAQRTSLLQTMSKELFIKIMIDGTIINDCIQYKDYTFWFNSVYKKQPKPEPAHVKPMEFNAKLALNN